MRASAQAGISGNALTRCGAFKWEGSDHANDAEIREFLLNEDSTAS